VSQELYAYLHERAQLGRRGLSLGLGLSLAAHVLVVGAILFTPKEPPAPEDAKVTWVRLPAAGVEGVAGGEGPMEEGKQGERQRRVEEVAPKRTEPTGYNASPNAFGTKASKPLQGTSTNADSLGKAPVASKGKNPAANPAIGAAGSGGGGSIGTATGIPGLKATNGVAGGTGLVGELDGDFPFMWYIQQVQSRVTGNWNRVTSSQGRVQIYFRIRRDGGIDGARIEIPSGNANMDQSALMAVRRSDPLPRLPDGFEAGSLGVRFWFTYLGN
jgi:TonB family protein